MNDAENKARKFINFNKKTLIYHFGLFIINFR
jgi:hypothetical protein